MILPRSLVVQLIPSGEVRMAELAPVNPTATNWFPVQVMENRMLFNPEFLLVQDIPSGEVKTVLPYPPTATNWLPVHVTEVNE